MRSYCWLGLFAVLNLSLFAGSAGASEASILDADAVANADGTYGFNVTVSHQDEGWTHYVNKWEILTPEGKVIETRTLFHPHVKEQPFISSLGRVVIPDRG